MLHFSLWIKLINCKKELSMNKLYVYIDLYGCPSALGHCLCDVICHIISHHKDNVSDMSHHCHGFSKICKGKSFKVLLRYTCLVVQYWKFSNHIHPIPKCFC